MSFYSLLVFIHIVAAVMGLGAAFAFPVVAKSAKTTSQAKHILELLKKLEIFPKVGSIALLLTGLIMGILNTSLFTSGWYITSLVIYLLVQVIVVGLMPKKMKAQAELLANHTDEKLPEPYFVTGKQIGKLEGLTHAAAFIMIILMVFKPF